MAVATQGLLRARSSNLGSTNQTSAHTSAPERPPPPSIGKKNHHSIELFWDEALDKANELLEQSGDMRVRVTVQEQDKTGVWGNVYTGYSGRHTMEGLETWTGYKYRIRFMNDHGCSEWSGITNVTTAKEPFTGEHLNKAVVRQNIPDIVRILDSGEVNIDTADKYGYTPIMQSAQKEFVEILEVLLERKPDVNFQNDSGKTALMLACYAGKLASVKELRFHKARYDMHDKGGSTPLHWAMDGGNLDLIKWMLKDGADVAATDINGWTPLLRTGAVGGNHNAAALLIRGGADVDVRDKDGKTTLMLAVVNGHQSLVELLLASNADLKIKNEYGKTAYEMAVSMERRGCMKAFEEFLQNGPKISPPADDE